MLSPLRMLPWLHARVEARICDRWPSAAHVRDAAARMKRFRLRLLHARNDADIPWAHADRLFEAAAAGMGAVVPGVAAQLERRVRGVDGSWRREAGEGGKWVTARVVEFGAHNGVIEGGEALWEVLQMVEGTLE